MPGLTQETILAMEAGPEMDALVAERVMGSHVCTEAGGCGVNYGKRYSSDIAAAWEVVARLPLVNRDSACIGFRVHRDEAGAWIAGHANAYPYEGEGWSGLEATAPTAPLAICRAALLTTLEEE